MSDKGINIGEAENVHWGTNDKFSAWGFLQSDGQQGEASVAELKDEWGQLVGLHVYDKKKTRTAEIVAKKSVSVPQYGEDVTVDGKKYLCRGVSLNGENENFRRLSLTLEAYENVNGYNGGVDVG